MFLNRQRNIPATLNRDEQEIAHFCSKNTGVEDSRTATFMILDDTSKTFPKFNPEGHSLLIKFKYPGEEQEPTVYLKECIAALTIT